MTDCYTACEKEAKIARAQQKAYRQSRAGRCSAPRRGKIIGGFDEWWQKEMDEMTPEGKGGMSPKMWAEDAWRADRKGWPNADPHASGVSAANDR